MTGFDAPQFTPLGATALLARFGDRIDRDLSLGIAWLVETLDKAAVPGVVDLIPAYTTVVVLFDPEAVDIDAMTDVIATTWKNFSDSPNSDNPQTRDIEIPVLYGGNAGPDLVEVAGATGLTADEVIRRHSEATYTVGALGFSPGFAFLIGLPPELEAPRRANPRIRVPPGSVGIGGAQTGIYSLPTPGGWSLIGRTPRTMFDPAMASDDELRPGDRIRFVPIHADDVTFPDPRLTASTDLATDGAVEILDAGVQSSVQDLGRPGQGRLGITSGGAADRSALIAGNRLLGNPDDAAAIEWTLLPPAIRFHHACRIVLTGADPGWMLDGDPIQIGEIVIASADDELRARLSREPLGARGYLCVAGGIDVPVVRESRSLDLSAGFGGGFGRPLRRGDRLLIGDGADNPYVHNEVPKERAGNPSAEPFRVVRGPQVDRFDDAAWSTFLSGPFTVDPQSNRMGLRLNGPAIPPSGGADVISEGVVTGAVQVTGSGQPIVLLPGRATIGGYTKIATVIEADHDRLGQLRPGSRIRFAEVSIDEAGEALRDTAPSVYGGLMIGRADEESSMTDDTDHDLAGLPTAAPSWTPEGVIAVIRELAQHDVKAFSLRVESAGLEIAIDRGGGLPGRPEHTVRTGETAQASSTSDAEHSDDPKSDGTTTVTAPLLGTFYRRTSPDAPMLVEVGDTVEAGQPVGLIEVMKTYHDVSAPVAGVVTRMLVEDGASVEFGEELMELDPLPEGE